MRQKSIAGCDQNNVAWLYNLANNTEDALSLGQLKLNYKYTPPPPMEHLTFETEITNEYLTFLKSGVST